MCFTSQDATSEQIAWDCWKKTKKPQNHNNKQHSLAGHGFTEAKWVVASKSEHSYTKREAASVQGAQQ